MAFKKFGKGEGEQWARNISDIMDEMMNRSFVGFRHAGAWQPAMNVYETPDVYYVAVELAGVEQDDVNVRCEERRLIVEGVRAQPRPESYEGALSVHVLEIDEGRFERAVDLPEEVDIERVEANYIKGYLWVTLPRKTPYRRAR